MCSSNEKNNLTINEKEIFVFAACPGGGNPCRVVFGADGMSDEDLQQNAASYAWESVYIFAGETEKDPIRFRFYTPNKELSSCGHASIGALCEALKQGLLKEGSCSYEAGGVVSEAEVVFRNGEAAATAGMQLPDPLLEGPAAEEVAKVLGITVEELGDLPILNASTSRYKLMVPLKSREVLDNLKPDYEALWKLCDSCGSTGFYPFAEEDDCYYTRQFPNNTGYPEDAATGVAASALSVYLAEQTSEGTSDGIHEIEVRQGYAMGKPSKILAGYEVADGQIVRTWITGGI